MDPGEGKVRGGKGKREGVKLAKGRKKREERGGLGEGGRGADGVLFHGLHWIKQALENFNGWGGGGGSPPALGILVESWI